MTAEEIEPIFRTSNRLIRETDCGFHRYLSKEIDWNEPFVCIMGARGAGKTTLMLQHIMVDYAAAQSDECPNRTARPERTFPNGPAAAFPATPSQASDCRRGVDCLGEVFSQCYCLWGVVCIFDIKVVARNNILEY